jgi:hypothetical protein
VLRWLDPIHGSGYQFWSGIGSTIAPACVAVMLWLTPSRCHELGCRRRARGASPLNGFYYCDRHMVEVPASGNIPHRPSEP